MTSQGPSLEISTPKIVVVAPGDSPSAQANARGHLFEKFIARLFEAYGCEQPKSMNLNVKQNGYELDLVTRFDLTKAAAIAECKAYSSPLPVKDLSNFLGKLTTARYDDPSTHGWFVAIPGLTSDGHQLARKVSDNDQNFRLITVEEIFDLISRRGWVKPISVDNMIVSDHGILISDSGLYTLVKELDPATRLPIRILVSSQGHQLTAQNINLLGSSDYGLGLPVQEIGNHVANPQPTSIVETPTLVTVVGSRGDFEYQFPASPRFFVGRTDILMRVRRASEEAGSTGRVLVLNAQSGWGKSSLALSIADQAKKAGGTAIVYDTRTATAPTYVAAALRRALDEAAEQKHITPPQEASYASLQSALATLKMSRWHSSAPLVLFFDQFENIFRDQRLTQEFRDLALAVRELPVPVLLGFSWKTDLVGLTENYPYRLRDEIRGVASVISVEPFGPNDVGTLLGRLAKAANTKLSAELKQRLREYSQGLPWLLKKLASHILFQLQSGATEELLLAESLNIETLFDQDLASLQPSEVEALKTIAREAPVPVDDIVERVSSEVIQSLVDQRLIVRVGSRVDVYWDIFREFLISGKVSVADTYILRIRPASTSKLLQYLVSKGGEVSAAEAAQSLSMSLHVIFNASRELRQLGVLVPKTGALLLAEQFRDGAVDESKIRARVARALKRHTVYTKVHELLTSAPSSELTIEDLARELPPLFPAVQVSAATWKIYAGSFAAWLDYAGLLKIRGQFLSLESAQPTTNLLTSPRHGKRNRAFPQGWPIAFLEYVRSLSDGIPFSGTQSTLMKAQNDAESLGLVDQTGNIRKPEVLKQLLDPASAAKALHGLLSDTTAGSTAIPLLVNAPYSSAATLGAALQNAYGTRWAPATMSGAGSKFRAWAKQAGLPLETPRSATEDDNRNP